MPQYVANGSRHLLSRCPQARADGAQPVRVDQRPDWLAAARAVLLRCSHCWREWEARQSSDALAQDQAELVRAQAAATDRQREVVRELETVAGGSGGATLPPSPPAPRRGPPAPDHSRPARPSRGEAVVARDLLLEIARCPEAETCLETAGTRPCSTVVRRQGTDLRRFQVPEPWSGHLETAPILFVSSNPSLEGEGREGVDGIDQGHGYPRWRWSDDDIVEFFEMRFGGGQREWIRDGVRNVHADGTTGRAIAFWAGVRQRAWELLQRVPRPGTDYALTEVVHCKSRQEQGVRQAVETCAARYLHPTLAASGARVIVVLGAIAREAVASELGISASGVQGPVAVGAHKRLITFLPHPNAHQARSFADCISATDLSVLRAALQPQRSPSDGAP